MNLQINAEMKNHLKKLDELDAHKKKKKKI